MNILKKLTLAMSFAFVLSACHQITFVQSSKSPGPKVYEDNHVNLIFSLIEHSDPVDIKAKCGKSSWASVKTEDTLFTGFISMVDTALLLGLDLWDLQSVKVTCAE